MASRVATSKAKNAAAKEAKKYTLGQFLRTVAVTMPLAFFDVRDLAGLAQKDIESPTRLWVFQYMLTHENYKKGEKLAHRIELIQRPDKDELYSSLKVPWDLSLKRDYLVVPGGLDHRLKDVISAPPSLALDRFFISREMERILSQADLKFRMAMAAGVAFSVWPRTSPRQSLFMPLRLAGTFVYSSFYRRYQNRHADAAAIRHLSPEDQGIVPDLLRKVGDESRIPLPLGDGPIIRYLRWKPAPEERIRLIQEAITKQHTDTDASIKTNIDTSTDISKKTSTKISDEKL